MASFKHLLNPSATKRKGRGDTGHPCLSPLSSVKKEVAAPFIRIGNDTDVI
jgi:hypothetical protein